MLTEAEREHLFLLGLGRLPEVRYRACDTITPRLQRVLDVFTDTPAIVRTATWDVIAWNRAAAAVFTDYGQLAPTERNVLRLMFCEPRMRAVQGDWQSVARLVVASFRRDAARAGADAEVERLVTELSQASPEFTAMWRDEDVQTDGNGVKHLRHPQLGAITLEFSSFAVDARPDLSLIVFNPVSETDRQRIAAIIPQHRAPISLLRSPWRRLRPLRRMIPLLLRRIAVMTIESMRAIGVNDDAQGRPAQPAAKIGKR